MQPEESRIKLQPETSKETQNEEGGRQRNENEHETQNKDQTSRETSWATVVETDGPHHEKQMTRLRKIDTICKFY